MNKLSHVDPEELREALAEAPTPKAAKRLMVALSYVDGEPVATMAERYDISRSTLYHWLDRFENEPIEEAMADERRPGRPSQLSEADRTALATALAESPSEYGYDATEWSADLVRDHIESASGVSYSEGHAARLLRELS